LLSEDQGRYLLSEDQGRYLLSEDQGGPGAGHVKDMGHSAVWEF